MDVVWLTDTEANLSQTNLDDWCSYYTPAKPAGQRQHSTKGEGTTGGKVVMSPSPIPAMAGRKHPCSAALRCD